MAMSRYNSAAVRQAASQVKQCAAQIESSAIPPLRKVRGELPDNFVGDAANALNGRLTELEADMAKITAVLNSIANVLNRFAWEIEEADRKIKASL